MLRSIDWITIAIYLALLVFGWVSVCGASYNYGDTDILSLGTRSGMQIIWIGTSIFIGLALLLLDDRFYDTFAYVIYAALLLLLFVTIFNPHEIKGSRSWLVLGPLRLQPAEFAKFATALAVARLMSTYGYNIHRWKHFASACAVVLMPMVFIVAQKETGSALVYLSFFLMFYREGMPGGILFTAVAMVLYFVVGIKFEDVMLWDGCTSAGDIHVGDDLRQHRQPPPDAHGAVLLPRRHGSRIAFLVVRHTFRHRLGPAAPVWLRHRVCPFPVA